MPRRSLWSCLNLLPCNWKVFEKKRDTDTPQCTSISLVLIAKTYEEKRADSIDDNRQHFQYLAVSRSRRSSLQSTQLTGNAVLKNNCGCFCGVFFGPVREFFLQNKWNRQFILLICEMGGGQPTDDRDQFKRIKTERLGRVTNRKRLTNVCFVYGKPEFY